MKIIVSFTKNNETSEVKSAHGKYNRDQQAIAGNTKLVERTANYIPASDIERNTEKFNDVKCTKY